MKVFMDNDYKCHVNNDGSMREIEDSFFDGKCAEFIEGFRYVPEGEVWTRADGEVFHGEMIAPWKDYSQLVQCQMIYDRMLAQQADMQAALAVLGVNAE